MSRWEQWTSPQTILTVIGYFALGAGAWMSFDGRIARNETSLNELRSDVAENRADLHRAMDENKTDIQRMDDKLDRLIERVGR